MTYTTKIVKNPTSNRFEVLIAAIGSTEVFKHGSYKTYSRAEDVGEAYDLAIDEAQDAIRQLKKGPNHD